MQKKLAIIDFSSIKDYLEVERGIFVKSSDAYDAYDDELIRSVESALIVLGKLELLHKHVFKILSTNSSLIAKFDEELGSVHEFFSREAIIETLFLDSYLIPEVERTRISDDESENILSESKLDSACSYIVDVVDSLMKRHLDNLSFLKTSVLLEVPVDDLGCRCNHCMSIFYSTLRDDVIGNVEKMISAFKADFDSIIHKGWEASKRFDNLRKDVERFLFKSRKKFRRSAANKLEVQVKDLLKYEFSVPSEIACVYSEKIKDECVEHLKKNGLRRDLVDEDEFEKFLNQLGINIWKNEKIINREIRIFVKTILAYKRKDISATILKEYLGEFWIHSRARKLNRKVIYHMGPTNSGKTYYAIERLCETKSGCYLAPLRLLAAELYDTMNNKGVKTTLLTGEEVIEIEGASHYSSTIEMARLNETFDCCVIDEIQMINDSHRGWAWTRAFINMCTPEVHICGDNSVLDRVRDIVELTGDTLEIKNYERMTELKVEKRPLTVGELEKGDAVIVFSRRNALKYKLDLEQVGYKVSVVYGRLSPEVRREQARKFDVGETDIIVSTDAIAMGMNLPIKRIVFTTLSKYINSKEYRLTDSEVKQISGRAGRYLRFPIGYVSCLVREKDGLTKINEALNSDLKQKDQVMVGPDLDIFSKVNSALEKNSLPLLKLSEFLRLFNTMKFQKPFTCVNLSEMIELAETVEDIDHHIKLSSAEIFGFSCAPVNQGLVDHVQHYVWILTNFVNERQIIYEDVDDTSSDIDYLETSIKCVELFQWLARHFNDKFFEYNQSELLENKGRAISRLNDLLSEKTTRPCSSCGNRLEENSQFNICESCFKKRRLLRRGDRNYEKSRSAKGHTGHKKRSGGRPRKYSGK